METIAAWLNAPPDNGPRFARLLTRGGTPRDLPRPSVTPIEVKTRHLISYPQEIADLIPRAAGTSG